MGMGKIVAGSASKVILIFLATFAITIPCLEANIGEYDDYLLDKAKEARRIALQAYEPNFLNVTSEMNLHVKRALAELNGLEGHNDTRRELKGSDKNNGRCKATNPIDRCWRCREDWADDRFRLATCAKGFARKVTGGLGGQIYVVTTNEDDDVVNPKPGTLRYGVVQREPLWIIFAKSMTIKLKQELMVGSDKTIDGRGAQIVIMGGSGITMQFVHNVIIHNIRIFNTVPANGGLMRDSWDHVGIRTRSDGDAISIFASSNIWIDHISMANGADGLVDIIEGSTGITISNCHMTRHNDVMLFGASDLFIGDKIMQVTVAFNHFGKKLIQRMPRVRWGFVHVVNNDYTHWDMYAIGGSSAPTILSQGNRFRANEEHWKKYITHRDERIGFDTWKNWQWRSENDLMLNGAIFIESGAPITLATAQDDLVEPQDGRQVKRLTKYAGALKCMKGQPC